jgi:hypothetical protein
MNVRFGSKPEILSRQTDVSFGSNTGHCSMGPSNPAFVARIRSCGANDSKDCQMKRARNGYDISASNESRC